LGGDSVFAGKGEGGGGGSKPKEIT